MALIALKQIICRIRGYHKEDMVRNMTRLILRIPTGECVTCHATIKGFGK